MDETRTIDAEQVNKGNTDLTDRMVSEGLKFSYNSEADVLSIIIGPPRIAITEPLIDDIMYRIEPETFKIVGIEIVCFFGDFVKKNKIVRKMMREYLDSLLKGEIIEIHETDRKRKIMEVLTVTMN
jgi:uncharacterized protein YuzE